MLLSSASRDGLRLTCDESGETYFDVRGGLHMLFDLVAITFAIVAAFAKWPWAYPAALAGTLSALEFWARSYAQGYRDFLSLGLAPLVRGVVAAMAATGCYVWAELAFKMR
jgi:hypothetical protein